MKKKLIGIVLVLLLVGTTACNTAINSESQEGSRSAGSMQNESSKRLSYTNITPDEAKKRLDSEKEIILLDVRTQEEYREKHIPNSLLIPVDEIEKEGFLKLTDKNATIFVYCRSGRRSVTASETLVKMGYSKVFNLGGIIDWPYETESYK